MKSHYRITILPDKAFVTEDHQVYGWVKEHWNNWKQWNTDKEVLQCLKIDQGYKVINVLGYKINH